MTPEEGLSLWSDNMLVPNQATHQANAEEWIDYYYDPEVAAKLAAWVNYICPVEGAREEMEKIDPSLVDNKLIFPDEETLAEDLRLHGARRPAADSLRRGLVRCHRWLSSCTGASSPTGRRRVRRASGCAG